MCKSSLIKVFLIYVYIDILLIYQMCVTVSDILQNQFKTLDVFKRLQLYKQLVLNRYICISGILYWHNKSDMQPDGKQNL